MGSGVGLAEGEVSRAGAAWPDVPLVTFMPALPFGATMSGADVVDNRLRPFRDTPPLWLSSVLQVLVRELSTDVSRVRLQAAERLLSLLRDSIWASTPAPFVSPSGPTSFSAEFVGPGTEVHVDVDAYEGSTVYVLEAGVEEWEGPLDRVPDGIEKWAWRLAHN